MGNRFLILRWDARLWLVIFCSAALAFCALATIPIEAHEAFVLLAAQHMRDTGDWVIPYFNGAPHLTKPPLNYWLTTVVSLVAGSERVFAWHGRLVSALSGVGLVAVTAWSARRLFDARTGVLAAAIVASCSGFFYYTHTARPEMTYAFLCALAIAAWLRLRTDEEVGSAMVYGMWLAFAAAILCKGPQLPVMLLVAFFIDSRWQGNSLARSLRVLRPLSGLLLMAVVTLPWWWLLDHRLGGTGLKGTQLSGTLLRVNPFALFSPYYLYRPLQLLLPWIIFLPALRWIGDSRLDRGNLKLLGLLVILPAVILSFGPQKRWYYMLPSLLPMATILAACIGAWVGEKSSRISTALGTFFLVFVLAFSVGSFVPAVWGQGRYSHAELAQIMRQNGSETVPQVTWGVTPEVFAFYSRRVVHEVESAQEIVARIDSSPSGRVVLLLAEKNADNLPPGLKTQVVGKAVGDADDEPVILMLVERL